MGSGWYCGPDIHCIDTTEVILSDWRDTDKANISAQSCEIKHTHPLFLQGTMDHTQYLSIRPALQFYRWITVFLWKIAVVFYEK